MADPLELIHERLLVARCQAGDEAAFVEMVARYQPRLTYFLRKMLGSPANVDDVLQEVWLDVYVAMRKLTDAGAFRAWIYRITRNRAYRELRRPRRTVALADANELSVDADEEAYSADEVGLIHECLDVIAEEHRDVLVLRFLEDMSYDEVAAVVGCPVGTVRSRLHYAKRALRSELKRRMQR